MPGGNKQVVLGFVSTAVDKHFVGKRIASHIGAHVVDLDRVLCDSPRTIKAVNESGPPYFKGGECPKLLHVIQRLPRIEILTLWREALQDALVAIRVENRDAPRVLLCGIMYHSKRRSEFYSPVDITSLVSCLAKEKLEVGRVAMFIDDVYDMYSRLAACDALYDSVDSIAEEYGRIRVTESLQASDFGPSEQMLIASEVQTGQLIGLLHWRLLEITQAERVARSFNRPYLLWAVKQQIAAIKPWLRGEEGLLTAYVSHPISRPRREQAATKAWPAIVDECNALQSHLAALTATAVMPTGIDEYRIMRTESVTAITRPKRYPALLPRWPLIDGELLYQPPLGQSAPDYESLLAPHRLEESKTHGNTVVNVAASESDLLLLDPPLRFLEREIAVQVAARDHTLVVNTEHTIVFRPFFKDSDLSRGVSAEIDHWAALALTQPKRRIAFLHRLSDARALLTSVQIEKAREVVIRQSVAERIDGNLTAADRLLAQVAESDMRGAMLDTGPATAGERRSNAAVVAEAYNHAPERVVWKIMGRYGKEIPIRVPRAQVGVWVVDDRTPWEEVLPTVIEFLKGTPISRRAFALAEEIVARA